MEMKHQRMVALECEIQRQLDEVAGIESEDEGYKIHLRNVAQLQALLDKELSLDKQERLSDLEISKAESDIDVAERKMALDEAKHALECGKEESKVDLEERRFALEERQQTFEEGKFDRQQTFKEAEAERELRLEEEKLDVERFRIRSSGKPRFDWNSVLLAGANILGIVIIVAAEVAGERILTSKALKYAGNFRF